MPLQIIDTGTDWNVFVGQRQERPPFTRPFILKRSLAEAIVGFESVANQWPSLDLDRLLSEMSRLNGIMNIEAGVDGEMLSTSSSPVSLNAA